MSEKNLLEVVRIKDPSGSERNATRAEAERVRAKVLDEPTHDKYGRPIPAHRTTKSATPDEKSTHGEIDAYAASHGIDLTGSTTKSDKLAAVAAADTQES